MKLSTAAVWPMVSVPCPMTMPSAPAWISSPMARASVAYSGQDMFSEKTPKIFLVVRLHRSASSGTAP